MSRVTSKRQVTIPKAVADAYGIGPGSDVRFEPAGEVIRLRVGATATPSALRPVEERLALFDAASARIVERQVTPPRPVAADRGWSREELYDRGVPR